MKIGIGNDHVAVEYKTEIKKDIEEKYEKENDNSSDGVIYIPVL